MNCDKDWRPGVWQLSCRERVCLLRPEPGLWCRKSAP